ncbi:MAG: PCRF domain-containing protein, partial [bacterium]|nr:PCRF domain-containing protein [bacterium]
MKDMLDKILQIEQKYMELGETLSKPEVIQDYNKFRDLSKQRKAMEETVELYHKWKKATDEIEDAKEMMH